MNFARIGFIGCGNMGGALARGCSRGESELWLADGNSVKAQELANCVEGKVAENAAIAGQCDLIFLGVKPQVMGNMLAGISSALAQREDRFVLVTMAAGLNIQTIRAMAGGDYPVIRIMPNTPAAIGEGMILYCSDGVEPEELAAFRGLMQGTGKLDELPEGLIDAGSALSGCGPAFVYQFIEALADGAVACGLPRDKAQQYAAQTLLGSAKMVLESGKHPGELKDAVCSPGGSTIQGVRAMEQGGLRSTVISGVIAAYEKTVALGK